MRSTRYGRWQEECSRGVPRQFWERACSAPGSPRAYEFLHLAMRQLRSWRLRQSSPIHSRGGVPTTERAQRRNRLAPPKERRTKSKIKSINFFPPLSDSDRSGLLVDTFSCLAWRVRCARLLGNGIFCVLTFRRGWKCFTWLCSGSYAETRRNSDLSYPEKIGQGVLCLEFVF